MGRSRSHSTLAIQEAMMAETLDPKEIVKFREMVMMNTIQVDTMYQLLIQKGCFTEAEFLNKLKEVSRDYGSRDSKV